MFILRQSIEVFRVENILSCLWITSFSILMLLEAKLLKYPTLQKIVVLLLAIQFLPLNIFYNCKKLFQPLKRLWEMPTLVWLRLTCLYGIVKTKYCFIRILLKYRAEDQNEFHQNLLLDVIWTWSYWR